MNKLSDEFKVGEKTTTKSIGDVLIDIDGGLVEYPLSVIDYVPSGPRVLIAMTFNNFPTRMLLSDSIPNDLGLTPTYMIIGSTNDKFPIGVKVVLDTYSGGSETKIFDVTNENSFVNLRNSIHILSNSDREKLFKDTPTVKVVEHFIILEGNIAAFDYSV